LNKHSTNPIRTWQAISCKESDYQRSHWSCAISKESSQDPKWVASVQIPKGIYIFSFQGYVGRDQPQNSDCQEWFHAKVPTFFFEQKIAKSS
jgi:hypothetical protein